MTRQLEVDLTLKAEVELPLSIPLRAVAFTVRGDVICSVHGPDKSSFVEFAREPTDKPVYRRLFHQAAKLVIRNPLPVPCDILLTWDLVTPTDLIPPP